MDTTALAELLALLRATPQGSLPLTDIRALETTVRRLGYDDPCWVDTEDAKALLGITHDGTVPALIRLGHFRHRALSNGRIEVRLVDVHYERIVRESLLAIGGDELTEAELKMMNDARPGTNPWDREETLPSQ